MFEMSSNSGFCNMMENICSHVAKYVIYGYSLQQTIRQHTTEVNIFDELAILNYLFIKIYLIILYLS